MKAVSSSPVPVCPHLHEGHYSSCPMSSDTETLLSCRHGTANSSQCYDRGRRAEMDAANRQPQILPSPKLNNTWLTQSVPSLCMMYYNADFCHVNRNEFKLRTGRCTNKKLYTQLNYDNHTYILVKRSSTAVL